MDNKQPRMIPIKKFDGTIERVTLEEFKKRQKSGKQTAARDTANAAPNAPDSAAIPAVVPLAIKPAPVVKVLTREPKIKETSLLEEPLEAPASAASVLSNDRMDEVERIIKRLRFVIREPERLKKVIQARIKDIRSVADTKEKLMSPIERGGVGLSLSEAEQVLSACSGNTASNSAPQNGGFTKITPRPTITPAASPSSKSSVMDIFVEQRSMSEQADDISSLIRKTSGARTNALSESTPMRPMVRDVTLVKKSGFGPVDEIQSYTLVDFRRLAAKPAEAATRLKQKFINLQDESYLFYIKALIAWRQSPLYLAMMEKVTEALNKGVKFNDVLTPEGIKMDEMSVLIDMEKELN